MFLFINQYYILNIQRDRESDDTEAEDDRVVPVLRTPSYTFLGHNGPVVASDWLLGGDQIISASWDRTACLYDVETGELLNSLTGKQFITMFNVYW